MDVQPASHDSLADDKSIQNEKQPTEFDEVLFGSQRRSRASVVPLREVLAAVALVVLCDITVYRGHGFAGYAMLFALAPVLLWFGASHAQRRHFVWIVGTLLIVLAMKLVWCGSTLLVAAGFVLVLAFAMSLSGQPPYIFDLVVFSSQTIRAGYDGLNHYGRSLAKIGFPFQRAPWLNFVLPVLALLVFGMIFIFANPDLLASFSKNAELFFSSLRDWLVHFSLFEVVFCITSAWISVGLLRPFIGRVLRDCDARSVEPESDELPQEPAAMYSAFGNTLVTVIGLFAIYLVFEFKTLWFREFPDGFYYSGYAHEGAAWLTVALALSTVVLSLVFREHILHDPRLPRLRWLAWVWSIENLVLALAVINRLFIYINFNGMTRMRIVGMFGISSVVVGFVLVLWKIAHNRDFVWLVRRHMWTVALAVYLFALTPVDAIVVRYNVRRILAGDPAPSVQISVHPISSEGVSLLHPLLNCEDPIIREGVRAMLAERDEQASAEYIKSRQSGWTAFQFADQTTRKNFIQSRQDWARYQSDTVSRERALRRFHDYAYQWY